MLKQQRWKIIASIRTFDLRMGQRLAQLFAGAPADEKYRDKGFPNVRHIHIPIWEVDELNSLLAQASALSTAVRSGGDRLFDLARTPFNTRLLADLITSGVDANAFGQVSTQSQLLELYWARRVLKHGQGADACLHNIVAQMVDSRSLRANRIEAAKINSSALQHLLAENVLVSLPGDRYVAFRHHILFDFVASRVYLDLRDLAATSDVLHSDRGRGLMLGPALIFALNELWMNGGAQRVEFWQAIITCVGFPYTDPVARSIAARTACELPIAPSDVEELARILGRSTDFAPVKAALAHVVGSLAVRSEDGATIPLDPWCYFASEIAKFVEVAAWPLRTLLFLLTKKPTTPTQGEQLSFASRSLLNFALTHPDTQQIAAAAIQFVAHCFPSAPRESRDMLSRLFRTERTNEHAHEDIPWLARDLEPIARTDPEFVVYIYEMSFARGVEDTTTTTLGSGRILGLNSTRKQDYESTYWSLKEFFSRFIEISPLHATSAYVKATAGYIRRAHPTRDFNRKWDFSINGAACSLQEDYSSIWASDPNDPHADNAIEIGGIFSRWLRSAEEHLAGESVRLIVSQNEFALVWARLFMVAAERPATLGHVLRPYVTAYPFLSSSNTQRTQLILSRRTTRHGRSKNEKNLKVARSAGHSQSSTREVQRACLRASLHDNRRRQPCCRGRRKLSESPR